MTKHPHFMTRLAKIEGRVRSLRQNHHLKNAKVMTREANTCEAELEHLYAYAVQHEIDIAPHYDKIVGIQTDLTEVKTQLESRVKSLWGRAVGFLTRAIDVVLDFFGLAGITRRLIGGIKGFLKSGQDD